MVCRVSYSAEQQLLGLIDKRGRPFGNVLGKMSNVAWLNSLWSWLDDIGSWEEKQGTNNVGSNAKDAEKGGRGRIDEVWRGEWLSLTSLVDDEASA